MPHRSSRTGTPLGADTVNVNLQVATIDLTAQLVHAGGVSRWHHIGKRNGDDIWVMRIKSRSYRGSVYLHFWTDGGYHSLRIGFEVSRLFDPTGVRLCPIDKVWMFTAAVVMWLVDAGLLLPLCHHTHWDRPWTRCTDPWCFMSCASYSRLDLAIDFVRVKDTRIPAALVLGWPQTGLKGKLGGNRRAWVWAGPNGRQVAVYPRHAKNRLVPKDVVRVEVRGHKHVLGRHDLSRATRPLNSEAAWAMWMDGFHWAGLDGWYGGSDTAPHRLRDLDPRLRRSALDFLHAPKNRLNCTWDRERLVRAVVELRAAFLVPGLADVDQPRAVRRLSPRIGAEVPRLARSPRGVRRHKLVGVRQVSTERFSSGASAKPLARQAVPDYGLAE